MIRLHEGVYAMRVLTRFRSGCEAKLTLAWIAERLLE